MRKSFIVTILAVISICVNAQKYSQEDWIQDIKYLKDELPRKHINLYDNLKKSDYELQLDAIAAEVPKLTDEQVSFKLQQIIAKVDDTHTSVKWSPFINEYREKNVPSACFRSYWFKDGLYIIEARQRDSIIVGKKIRTIGSVDVNTVIDSLKTLFPNENNAIKQKEIAYLIGRQQVLQHFGFAPIDENKYVDIEVEDKNNNRQKHRIVCKKDRGYSPYSSSNYLIEGAKSHSFEGWFSESYDRTDSIYFIKYNKCYGRELAIRDSKYSDKIDQVPSFNDFKESIINTVNNNSINKLIFDLRYNGGGSSWQGTKLIRELAEIEKINGKGKIFVLIGRNTFSSATLNVLDFQERTDAIFIGEDTKGKPSHYGEVETMKLPNTGLKISYSKKYFYHSEKKSKTYLSKRGISRVNDKRNTFSPDYYVELSFSDFEKQKDIMYDWIKNLN